MPTILRIGRYRFFFFSKERQEPPPIHVEAADCYAKYWIDRVALDRSVGYYGSELSELYQLVEHHRGLFLERWHAYFGAE